MTGGAARTEEPRLAELGAEAEREETFRWERWYADLQRRLTADDAAELSHTVEQKERRLQEMASRWPLPFRRRPRS